MKTLDMLTRKELQAEYKLSRAFIREHAAEMGAIGERPQLFNREHVERFLDMLITERIRTNAEKEQKVLESRNTLARSIKSMQFNKSTPPSVLDWRGGRSKVAS